MSPSLIGAAIGSVIGLLSFVALRFAASNVERQGTEGARKGANMFRIIAFVDLVLFTAAGYFFGPLIMGSTS